jgi:hypothetical protein
MVGIVLPVRGGVTRNLGLPRLGAIDKTLAVEQDAFRPESVRGCGHE